MKLKFGPVAPERTVWGSQNADPKPLSHPPNTKTVTCLRLSLVTSEDFNTLRGAEEDSSL